MTGATIEVTHSGTTYLFDGKGWVNKKTRMLADTRTTAELNHELIKHETVDELTDPQLCLQRAKFLRDNRNYELAIKYAMRAAALDITNIGIPTILSSIFRVIDDPEMAVKVTEHYRTCNYAPILTTRAAALCDLARYEEALKTVKHALAISGSGEAFGVHRRLKKECPALFEEDQ